MLTSVSKPGAHRPVRSLIVVLALVFATVGLLAPSRAEALSGVKAEAVSGTGVKVSWKAVSGAGGYKIQYSTSSKFSAPKYLPASTSDTPVTGTTAVVNGLYEGKTWYFRVIALNADRTKTTGSYSAAVSAKPTYSFGAPTKLSTVNAGSTQVELEWLHVSGAPGYRVRASAKGKPTVYASTGNNTAVLKGLVRNTSYSFQVYVESPATGDMPALAMGPWSAGKTIKTLNNALLAPTKLAGKDANHNSVTLTWDAPSGVTSSDQYKIRYGLNSALTQGAKEVYGSGSGFKLTGLQDNTNYYVRVTVVDAAKKARSDTSEFALVKTRVPIGHLQGSVDGVKADEAVAMAYEAKSMTMVQQVDLTSGNKFDLAVRPGSYKVLIAYVGGGNVQSRWATTSGSPVPLPTSAGTFTVALGKDTSVKSVALGAGHKISGTVTDASTGKAILEGYGPVDVTALSTGTGTPQVMARAQTDKSGKYTLDGLAPGTYKLRMKFSGIGFNVVSRDVTVKTGDVSMETVALPVLTKWSKSYLAYVDGTSKVGSTVKAHAYHWKASVNPTEWATSATYQWNLNGKAIKGATKSSYKIAKADKGKKISVTVRHYHVGFKPAVVTSKAWTVK